MSLLVATPMFNGSCTREYWESSLALESALTRLGVGHEWLGTAKGFPDDSLITRARDKCAGAFLRSNYERLLFIDADIRFKPDDVAKLWNMDADIAVGAYPMKRAGAPLAVWMNGRLRKDMKNLPNPSTVDYAGTGFMMIKRHVFDMLRETPAAPPYDDGDPLEEFWGFFQDPIIDRVKWSEDYYFCDIARRNGFLVKVDPTIRLGHVGRWVYEGA